MKTSMILKSAVLALLFSCSSYKKINLWSISPGMTKQEVIKKLRKKPDNLIATKMYPQGRLDVVQYSRYEPMLATLQERYWLYFLNDTLLQWGRPGDWAAEADKIIEIRHR